MQFKLYIYACVLNDYRKWAESQSPKAGRWARGKGGISLIIVCTSALIWFASSVYKYSL